jgi:arsenical pump membrane protein
VREAISLAALAALLLTAVRRPRGVPEFVVAVPAVGLLLAIHAVSWSAARHVVEQLGPVVGFLAAVLVLADGCDREGVFRAAGGLMARAASRSSGSLLLVVSGIAAVTTAVLSLDTTVVLLTPVVVATVRVSGVPARQPLYATAHLANSASLLLPVSNLTNLLAFALVPVSFGRFSALMALPWLVAIGTEILAVRIVFRGESLTPPRHGRVTSPRLPRFATGVVVLTVVGFGVGEVAGVAPLWFAVAGAAVLSGRRLLARRTTVGALFRSTSPSFCLFVLGLGIVVGAAADHGLSRLAREILPNGSGLWSLLGIAAVAAIAANLINTLPATLLLLPVAAAAGLGPVLAVLIGVNIGPNLTYPGSLATLLWRRAVAAVDGIPTMRDFTAVGLASTPPALVLSTVALWAALKL